MFWGGRLLVRVVVLSSVACKGGGAPGVNLPSQDLPKQGTSFDPNEVIPSLAFTDFAALGATDIAHFLSHTPYGTTSFLATYESNGLSAAAAIAHAATTFRINPIALMAALEAQGGLIAAATYPVPTEAVDYVFDCGCTTPTTCDASAAGLDLQLNCYAEAIRESLDAVAANGQTDGGWGPGRTITTADGVKVDPVDDSTAALYQWDPVAGTGTSDNSLLHDVWLEYVSALSYKAPTIATGATAEVGDGCVAADDCNVASPICVTGSGYPGGLCTTKCKGSCAGEGSFCADFSSGGYCLAVCSPTDLFSCRTGYACTEVEPFGSDGGAAPVCIPSQDGGGG